MNTNECQNGLDPGQDQRSVGPDLDPNSCKDYTPMKKVIASKEE